MLYDLYQQPGLFVIGLTIVFLWEIIWKGFGLWISAQNKQKSWFIVILIFSTLGLLPIIYLIWFKEKENDTKKQTERLIEDQNLIQGTNTKIIKEKVVQKKSRKKVNKKKIKS